MDILVATIWTALALFLLYETSAVYSYLKLTSSFRPLNYLTKAKNYENCLSQGCMISYSEYMTIHHNNFFVKMFACKYCFGLWIAILISYFLGVLIWLPVVYFGGQLLNSGIEKLEKWMVNHA